MLGKMIKHEWKAVAKTLFFIHLAIVAMTLVGKIMISIKAVQKSEILTASMIVVYALSVIAVGIGTHIFLAMRFYKNMYTDEGYLSFTLPVKSWEHIVSKGLIAVVWMVIDGLIIFSSIMILTIPKKEYQELVDSILYADWSDFWSLSGGEYLFLVYIVVNVLLGLCAVPLTYYVSISIGQLFKNHKMLFSIIVYVVIQNVQQVLGVIVTVIFMLPSAMGNMDDSTMNSMTTANHMMGGNLLLQLVYCVGFFFAIKFIMDKKLNLN